MTRQKFCRERGISVHTLNCYRHQLGGQWPALGPALFPAELIETSALIVPATWASGLEVQTATANLGKEGETKTAVSNGYGKLLLSILMKGRNHEDIQYARRSQNVGRVPSRHLAQLDPFSSSI